MKPSRVQRKAKVATVFALTFGVTGVVTFGVSGCATQGQSQAQTSQGQSKSQQQNTNSSMSSQMNTTNATNTPGNTTSASNEVSTSGNGTSTAQQYYIDSKTYLIRPDNNSSGAAGGSNGSDSSGSSGSADASNKVSHNGGAAKEKIVLLTFDDGPNGASTRQILATLDKYHAKAIWFISGYHYGPQYRPDPNKAPQFDELVKAIQSDGNIIGNHTWMHDNLSKLPAQTQRNEVTQMNTVLKGITGETPRYLRPPYGVSTTVLNNEMKTLDMQWLNWSVGSMDWVYTDPNKVVHQVLSTVYNGGVILMHDNDVEAKALDPMLKALTAEGYHFVLPTEVRPN